MLDDDDSDDPELSWSYILPEDEKKNKKLDDGFMEPMTPVKPGRKLDTPTGWGNGGRLRRSRSLPHDLPICSIASFN